MVRKSKMTKSFIYPGILVFISILSICIVFRHGILRGHDIEFHLSRILGLSDSIKTGDIKALIHVGLGGYGYANGLFYGNLFIYLPSILKLCGLSLSKVYFIFVVLCNIITALVTFYVMKKVTKADTASFITTIIYLFSPYRLCDVIVRAAVGEMIAMMIIPIILLGIYEIIIGDYKKWWIFSLGFILLIQAHIISSIIMAVLCTIILLLNFKKVINDTNRLKVLINSIILGVLLGAYFIFPLMEQYLCSELMINNMNNKVNLATQSIPLERVFLGLSYYGEGVFYPPGIGLVFIILSLFRYKLNTNNKQLLTICDLCLIIGFVFLLMITQLFPWKELSGYLKFIQFPWRLYLYATVFLSISSGIIFYLKFNNNIKNVIYVCIYISILFFVSLSFNYNSIHNYWGIGGMEYIKGYNGYYIANGEYLPYGTDLDKLNKRGNIISSNNNDLKYNFERNGNVLKIEYNNNLKKDTYIELPLIYYLGYSSDKDYVIKSGKNNVIRIPLNRKKDSFTVYYKGTKIQHVSCIISLFTIILLILIVLRKNIGNQKFRRKQNDVKTKKNI